MSLSDTIRFALGYAKRQQRIVYVYRSNGGWFFVSLHCNGDYVVKVFPGGKRVFSLYGVRLANQWIDGIAVG